MKGVSIRGTVISGDRGNGGNYDIPNETLAFNVKSFSYGVAMVSNSARSLRDYLPLLRGR